MRRAFLPGPGAAAMTMSRSPSIRVGGVLLNIGTDPVTVRFVEEIPPLLRRIAELPIGTSLPVVYSRSGSISDAAITTDKLKKDRGEEAAFRAWGFTALETT